MNSNKNDIITSCVYVYICVCVHDVSPITIGVHTHPRLHIKGTATHGPSCMGLWLPPGSRGGRVMYGHVCMIADVYMYMCIFYVIVIIIVP